MSGIGAQQVRHPRFFIKIWSRVAAGSPAKAGWWQFVLEIDGNPVKRITAKAVADSIRGMTDKKSKGIGKSKSGSFALLRMTSLRIDRAFVDDSDPILGESGARDIGESVFDKVRDSPSEST